MPLGPHEIQGIAAGIRAKMGSGGGPSPVMRPVGAGGGSTLPLPDPIAKIGAIARAGLPSQVIPRDPGGSYTAPVYDPSTGLPTDGREPYAYVGRVQLAAGAQAINTDLADFLNSAASSDLTATDAFPFTWDTDRAALIISTNYNNAVTALVEDVAVIAGLIVIERKYNAEEQFRYSIVDFEPLVTEQGVAGTPTATAPAKSAAFYLLTQQYVPFKAHFVTNEQWQIVIRTCKAFTSIGLIDLVLVLRGLR